MKIVPVIGEVMGKRAPLVCITGPSGAGKTHFSNHLAAQLRSSGIRPVVIASDDYYRQHWTPDSIYGFDTVDAIDSEALINELSSLQAGRLQCRRRYDMGTREVRWEPLNASWDVVLLEGAFGPQLLTDHSSPELLIYVETMLVIRVMRRLRRDVRERQRSTTSVLRQMMINMLPGERRFIRPLKDAADLVVIDIQTGLTSAKSQIQDLLIPCRD